MDSLDGRDLVTLADLARDEIVALLDQARRFESAVASGERLLGAV